MTARPMNKPASELIALAANCPELNMSNYTESDVEELNNWAIEVAIMIGLAAAKSVRAIDATPPAQPSPNPFSVSELWDMKTNGKPDGAVREALQHALSFIQSHMRYSQSSFDSGEEPSDQFTYDAVPVVMELEAALHSPKIAAAETKGFPTSSYPDINDAAHSYPGPSDASPGDVLSMKEACKRIAQPWPGLTEEEATSEIDKAVISVRNRIAAAIDRLDVKPEAKSQEPDAWQWRFKQQGQWSRWIDLLPDHVDSFRQIQSHNLKSGNCETRPLYTHPTTKPEAPAVSVEWHPQDTAPQDGSHILVCNGPYNKAWGFNQSPPSVVHFFNDMDEPGFYLSSGIVQDSYNDKPVAFTHWRSLGKPPTAIAGGR